MSLKTKITIGGVDITSFVKYCSLSISDNLQEEDKGLLEIDGSVLDSTLSSISVNDDFKFYRGETVANVQRFHGFVSKVESQTGTINLKVKGEMSRIDRKEVNKTYDKNIDPEAGVISAIASDIMTDGGITPSVTSSGSVQVFNVFPCRREVRSRKLVELANVLRWSCYYDHNNDLGVFEPRGNNSTGVVLTVGSYPLINAPIWEEDDTVLFNQFTVEGLEVQVGRTDWFSGDASTVEFTLTEYPVSVNAVWSGSNNFKTTRPTDTDLVTGGAEDVTADADYYWREESKVLKFDSGSVPSSGTNNIQVDYNYNEALPGFFLNEDSQDSYGEREKTVTALYLTTVDDVDNLGVSLIEEYKDVKLSTRLLVGNDLSEFPNSANLYPNKTIKVIDNLSPKKYNRTLPIRKLILKYPQPYDELDVGEYIINVDDFLERTVDRIKKLEDRFKSQHGLRQYRRFDPFIEFPSQIDLETASPDAGVLYWDDDNQGTWDDFNWGDDTEETLTLVRRVHHPDGFMLFDLYDEDLIDNPNTTATINTTNKTVSFTDAQEMISEILFLNNQTYVTLLLELQNSTISGNLTYYACADGDSNTWEEITPGTTHTFSTADANGVKIRVVSTGVSSIAFRDSSTEVSTPWKITVT